MKYLAYKNDKGEEQSVKEHLENTAALCGEFADTFGGGYEWGYCCGLLHDLGKYSAKFQARLCGGEKVDHATAGARVCWDKGGMYQYLSYCIAGHHTGLLDTGGDSDTSTCGTMMGRRKKKLEDYLDTELFMRGESVRDSGESIDRLYEKLTEHIAGWLENDDLETVNGRRTEILKHCMEMGEREKGLTPEL